MLKKVFDVFGFPIWMSAISLYISVLYARGFGPTDWISIAAYVVSSWTMAMTAFHIWQFCKKNK